MIITKELKFKHVLGFIIWKKGSIYFINSTKNIMTKLKPFKERIHSLFLCMLGTWMLKVIQFTNHLRKKFKIIMKILIIGQCAQNSRCNYINFLNSWMLNCMNLYQDSKPLPSSNQASIVLINLVNNTLTTFTLVNTKSFL